MRLVAADTAGDSSGCPARAARRCRLSCSISTGALRLAQSRHRGPSPPLPADGSRPGGRRPDAMQGRGPRRPPRGRPRAAARPCRYRAASGSGGRVLGGLHDQHGVERSVGASQDEAGGTGKSGSPPGKAITDRASCAATSSTPSGTRTVAWPVSDRSSMMVSSDAPCCRAVPYAPGRCSFRVRWWVSGGSPRARAKPVGR